MCYTDLSEIRIHLNRALKIEEEKFASRPIASHVADTDPLIESWGYVIVAYQLAESAFKALLHIQLGKERKRSKIHSLSERFEEHEEEILESLDECYTDCQELIQR